MALASHRGARLRWTALLAGLLALGCTKPQDTEQGKVAAAFARTLCDGRFEDAHALLSPAFQATMTTAQLETAFNSMVSYGKSKPTAVAVMTTLKEWPDKQADDIGWAYVAITGDDVSEGISVIVTRIEGRAAIRAIEWGRP